VNCISCHRGTLDYKILGFFWNILIECADGHHIYATNFDLRNFSRLIALMKFENNDWFQDA
jgi:hypothetical protein